MSVLEQFSEAVPYYDQYSAIQQHVFLHLLSHVPSKQYRYIVDIGSGTGAATAQMSQRYPDAEVVGIDASPKMVMWAQSHYANTRLRFVYGQAENLVLPYAPDLVFSNAVFQWIAQPELLLHTVYQQMRDSGALVFSSFGPDTYVELASAIRQVWGRPVITSASRFVTGEQLYGMLTRYFGQVHLSQHRYQRRFDSLADLLRSIKYTGTRGLPEGPKQWTPGLFREVESAYLARYRHIVTTYQVYYCDAQR